MRVLERKEELRAELERARGGKRVGLVPTMGFLHDGHVSLLKAARDECDLVVMTLFVNPTQFGPNEDLDRYPRDLEGDVVKADAAGVDLVYAPAVDDLYPEGFATKVAVSGLTSVLCGAPSSRGSAHFDGVTTIVAKLLNIVLPDVAYFGQKDAQQALVIERMAADLDFPTRIAVLPTVREPDGLAMSSRNAYLSPSDRERATALRKGLLAATAAARRGAPATEATAAAEQELRAAGIEPEYLEVRDARDLSQMETFNGRPALIAIAASLGGARLIDNVIVEASGSDGEYQERTAAR
jgi:pantoate--beta-alanine ligase